MKTKFLQVILVVLASVSFFSCSNDDNTNNEVKQLANTVTVNGEVEDITKGAGNVWIDETIYISFTTLKEDIKVGDTYSDYGFRIPFNKIGEKIILEKNETNSWDYYYFIIFSERTSNGGREEVGFYDPYEDSGAFIGTNNWVQFTKDSKLENTYTVDFEINIEGKVIKGNYTTSVKVNE